MSDTQPREPGCLCQWEPGDSYCPKHGVEICGCDEALALRAELAETRAELEAWQQNGFGPKSPEEVASWIQRTVEVETEQLRHELALANANLKSALLDARCTPAERAVLDAMAEMRTETFECWRDECRGEMQKIARAELARREAP